MFSPCSLFCSGMTSATSLFFCTCAASTQKTIKKNTVSHSNTHTVSWKKWILHTQRATISDLNSPSRLQHCWSSRLWFVTTLTLWRYLACTPSPWCMNPGARRSDSLRRTPLFSLFFCDRSTTPLRAWCEGGFFHRSAVVPVPSPVDYTTTTTPANSEHETKTGFEQKVISRSQKSELKGRSVSQSLGVFGN